MSTENDTLGDLIQKTAQSLGEHFDSVQIFATKHEPGVDDGTTHFYSGVGNYFARVGHVKDWIIKQNEGTRIKTRNDED